MPHGPRIANLCLRYPSRRVCSVSTLIPAPAPIGAVELTNRRLIALHGHDATHFLHGLTTNSVRSGQAGGYYSAFLNAQGRVLHDVFIYSASHSKVYTASLRQGVASVNDPAYLIEVDAHQTGNLLKHLKRYKLRAKVTVAAVEEGAGWGVWSVWDEGTPWTLHPSASSAAVGFASGAGAAVDDEVIGCVDARAPGMGRRLVLGGMGGPSASDVLGAMGVDVGVSTPTPPSAYTIRRMLRGVAEGQEEIPREGALPQEYNLDFMGGIDFKKGCYVGQELTIRTHHTGVVRKRVLPVVLYGKGQARPERLEYRAQGEDWKMPPAGENVVPSDKGRARSAGKWIGGVGNIGLAVCRLEMMTDMVLTGEETRWRPEAEFTTKWVDDDGGGGDGTEEEVRIKAFVPDWIRGQIKVRNPQRRVE